MNVSCASCGRAFETDGPVEPKTAQCPDCRSLPDGARFCPFCSEQIQPAAIKCKFCNEFVDGRPKDPEPERQDPEIKSLQTRGIVAMVFSIAGIVMCGLLGIVGFLLGYFTNRRLITLNQPKSGFATAAVVIGLVNIGMFGLMAAFMVVAVAVPAWFTLNQAATEREAQAGLREIATAEEIFRTSDADGNGMNDYWVGDVAGLHRLEARPGTGAIRLLSKEIASADESPMDSPPAATYFDTRVSLGDGLREDGLYFAALTFLETAEEAELRYDQGAGRNVDRYGFRASATDEQLGEWVFIIGEQGVVLKKRAGDEVVESFPLYPSERGWMRAR